MTVFADQCIHKDLISALKNAGIQVQHASDVQLEQTTDIDIFDHAAKQKSILLTFDKDFGNILRFSIRNAFGIVIIYMDDMTKEEISRCTLQFFKKFSESQLKGKLFVVERDKIRAW